MCGPARPGGCPKHDLASEIAKACFENNADALYTAFSKALLRGNAYVFKALSDRAYSAAPLQATCNQLLLVEYARSMPKLTGAALTHQGGFGAARLRLPTESKPSFRSKFFAILIGFWFLIATPDRRGGRTCVSSGSDLPVFSVQPMNSVTV